MSFTAETTNAFQKRLAELAWNESDDLAKRTIISTIASQLVSDQKLMKGLVDKVHNDLENSIVERLHEDQRIHQATEDAIGTLMETIRETDFTAHAEAAMKKSIDRHAEKQISVAAVARMTSRVNLNAEIKQAIDEWTRDCTKSYLNSLRDSLTVNTKNVLLKLLGDAVNEIEDVNPNMEVL